VLGEATEHASTASPIKIRDEGKELAYDRLTLRSPRDGRVLIRELVLSVPQGCNLFVTGPNKTAKVALFRATAGIWEWGEGGIKRPGADDVLLLPERPYLPLGTLREILVRTASDGSVSDAEILDVLRLLDVDVVATRAGGLQVERDWPNILGLGELQLLAIARVVLAHPRFVLLDHLATALTPDQLARVLALFGERSITYVTVAEGAAPATRYDAVLSLAMDGSWSCTQTDVSTAADVTAGPG
jgi:putative ATP-binding cassette transporter